eukprot:TRINITY_DN4358_c2_g1_i5.p2 TRINITY_DN4358_c2_g1~~TRINITY_DN4358_c2_g1_i5.p2  ORF type:complete len:103 (-),score=15.27 TRINITY_DN4358_c2_g1_i5:30-338(-)
MLQSWFPRGVETALVKYGSSEFQICVGDQILYNDFLDKASESSQRTVQQEIQARLPKGQLPASVGSMGPVRRSLNLCNRVLLAALARNCLFDENVVAGYGSL